MGQRLLLQMKLHLTPSHEKLVGLGGFEPPTSPLSGVRSNQLSYRPELIFIINQAICVSTYAENRYS